jgi:serine/threonine-protein kinase
MAWKADLQRWKTVTAGEVAKAAEPKALTTARFNLALLERDYHAAQALLATGAVAEYDNDAFFIPSEWNEAIIAHGLGDRSKANIAFLAARERAAAAVRERAQDGKALIVLAQIDAALGAKEDAVREGQKAVELLPVAKDALNGSQILSRLTGIYAQVGEVDRAFESLLTVAKIPNGVTYGSLKLDEIWDPLRGDPRFQKIVASLAPKSAAK